MRLVRRTTGISPWGLVLLALCGLAIAPFASALPTPPSDSQRDLSASTFSSSLLEVAEDPPSPLRAVPAQSNRLFPRDEEDDEEEDEDGAYPRTSYEVCVQVDVPICAPGVTASIGLAGSLESAYVPPAPKGSTKAPPSPSPGFRSVTGVLNFAVQGDLFLGKFYAILEGEVSITSPNAASYKDLLAAFSRALLIRWFRSDGTIDANALTALSKPAEEERKFLMNAVKSTPDMRPGANGQLDAVQVDKVAAAFDVMRATTEACVSKARRELLAKLDRDTSAGKTLGKEIIDYGFDTTTWAHRAKKFKGFKTKDGASPVQENWRTWSVLAAEVQHEVLRFVNRSDSCLMDDTFSRNSGMLTHGDDCANVPPTRMIGLTPEVLGLMSDEAKATLRGGATGTMPTSVQVYPLLMCTMLRSAPDTEWLTDAAEEARMADADGRMTEADRAAAKDAVKRISERGASGKERASIDPAMMAGAAASAPLGEGHLWNGTTPGSTSDEQLHAMKACREKLQKDDRKGVMDEEVFEIPSGLDSLPEECAIFAKTGPSRELLDRDDDAREEGLLLGTAANGQRAEFVEKTLWSRTFPDINAMKNVPCSAEQLDPASTVPPQWCFVRISHASAELLFPLMRDLRFAFNHFADEIRKAESTETKGPEATNALRYEKVAQYVYTFTQDALRRYEESGWTRSSLVERKGFFVADPASRASKHRTNTPLASGTRRSKLFETGKASKTLLPRTTTSMLELSGRIEAGSRLHAGTRMTVSAAHRIGATHGGWLLDALADTLAALQARLARRAEEMAEMPFEMTVNYAFVASLTVTAGTSSVGLCTPDTNMLQLRLAYGWEGQLKVTASTTPAKGGKPEVRKALVEVTGSKTSRAVEFTAFPTNYLGFSIMFSSNGAASKRAHHQGTVSVKRESEKSSTSTRVGILVYLSMSDLVPTGLPATPEVTDAMLAKAGGIAAHLAYATAAPFISVLCKSNATCIRRFTFWKSKPKASSSSGASTGSATSAAVKPVDLGNKEVDGALENGKADDKTRGRWTRLIKDTTAAIAASAGWSQLSGTSDCSVAVLMVDLTVPVKYNVTVADIEVSSRLAIRSQFAVPIGFRAGGMVTLHALRGVTYDLKKFVDKELT